MIYNEVRGPGLQKYASERDRGLAVLCLMLDRSHENPDEIEKDWKPSGGGVYDSPEDAIGDAPVFNQKHRIKK